LELRNNKLKELITMVSDSSNVILIDDTSAASLLGVLEGRHEDRACSRKHL